MRFDLSDEEWALLEPPLPKSRRSGRVDDRKIVNAIFYVLRTGMPWRIDFGDHPTGLRSDIAMSSRASWNRMQLGRAS